MKLRPYLLLLACLLPVCHAAERLTLAVEDDWYPFAAVHNGKIVGMAVEIVREAYRAVGVEVLFRSMPYARCMRQTELGREVGCFNSLQDSSTRDRFLFGQQPLFHGAITIYAQSGKSQPVTLADLAGKRVGLTNGYTYGTEVETDRRMIKEYARNDLASLRKLALGRLDYALVYTRVADYLQGAYSYELYGKLQVVGKVIENPLYLSFSRTNLRAESALRQLDQGLSMIRSNGRYAAITTRWSRPPL
ncbi:substrate-binding periplasmic protein [Vogesella amnigena]|uniref:Substrate-binding periplasmic protein n=1 Tax=Vogesella amnigena TaxID=1507449 RepID=A0ABV7TR62_9NEIS